MICPQCGKLIGVSEEKCPFCGAWNPGMYGMAPKLQRWFGGQFTLIPVIFVTCIVLYVAALLLDLSALTRGFSLFNFLAPGTRALYQLGMTGGIAWRDGWWWTLFTAIFLHGSLLHIFFNLMWIRDLGPVAAQAYGPARAFVIFMVGGVVGFLISNLVTGSPTVGASGSVFGLLAALIVFARRTGSSMLKTQLWQWALIMFVMGFLMSSVNNWAHAGGFAGGWVAAQAMKLGGERRESPAVQVLAIAFLLVTAAGFVLSFVKVTSILMNAN
jgi:rhomboid protease GluP